MRKCILFCCAAAALVMTSCSVMQTGSREENSHTTVMPEIVSYNELTMDLDPEGVTYTIDISTPEGKLKLDKISLAEAQQLALVECLMKYNCATLFNPQYTHLKKGKDILRVTVYGFPARYKRIDTENDTETESVRETRTEGDHKVSTEKTTTRKRTAPRAPRKKRR